MTEIGFIIQSGESIPEDVLAFTDAQHAAEPDNSWIATEGGYRMTTAKLPGYIAPLRTAAELAEIFPSRWPLAVTAVREPEQVADVPLTTIECGVCGQKSMTSHYCGDESSPAPRKPETSTLLDLVRQHGDARVLALAAMHAEEPDVQRRHLAEAAALFERLAVLALQQPVQAHDDLKRPLWQHTCAAITAFAEPPKNGIDCTWCPQLDGPWRPLLVGGDPAPEQPGEVEKLKAYIETQAGNFLAATNKLIGEKEGIDRHRGELHAELVKTRGERQDALAEVERLTDERGSVLNNAREVRRMLDAAGEHDARRSLLKVVVERDEARAEVERLSSELDAQRARADDAVDSLDRHRVAWEAEVERLKAPAPAFTRSRGEIHVTAVLDAEGAPRLHVQWPPGAAELTDPEYGALRSRIAHLEVELAGTQQMLDVMTRQPDPLVLSLPEVPQGATLVGGRTGTRFVTDGGDWAIQDERGFILTEDPFTLGTLLDREDSLTVEMAPRERRTWPKLDGAPSDLKDVNGKHYRWKRYIGKGDRWYTDDNGDAPSGISLVEVQWFDGPLTEVFDDEPGGEQR